MISSPQKPSIFEKELSFKLQGIFILISREYGYLFKEKVYYNLLKEKFLSLGLKFEFQPEIKLFSLTTGKIIGSYYPDFLIENKIILEVKAQAQILDSHVNQLIRYLRLSKYELGYLVNFGAPKVQIIRRIYTNDRK